MTISQEAWKKYINGLDAVQTKAKELILKYIESHDVESEEGRNALIEFAYGVSTKYGEAAAEYACQMYDAIAAAEGADLDPAEPAPTATYSEVAKTINGTIKIADVVCAAAIYRLVKLAAQDTTRLNASRDKIYYAWIPVGDTCPYCLALAAGGWKKASQNFNGHSEHIHANCNCAYATKTKPDTTYKGYNPSSFQKMFAKTEGDTEKDKINTMRRALYKKEKEEP